MRGTSNPQSNLFSYISVEDRIPDKHPLRKLRVLVDAVLASQLGTRWRGGVHWAAHDRRAGVVLRARARQRFLQKDVIHRELANLPFQLRDPRLVLLESRRQRVFQP